MKRFLKNTLLIMMLLFVMVACADKKADNTKETSAQKDELVLGLGSEPDQGWDPIHGSGHYGTAIFQSALFKRDIDLNIESN